MARCDKALSWTQTAGFCSWMWLPVVLFLITTTSLFFTINPTSCSASVKSGALPLAAQQIYQIKNATQASWYYGSTWNVFPTRGVCPLGAKSGVSTDKKTGKQTPGDYQNCLKWGSDDWSTIDQYNSAAGVPTMVGTSTAFHVSYQATLVAIVVSCILAFVACINIFLSINSGSSGRHPYFTLLLLIEVLCYFIILLLACIIVGGPASSSIADPKAWSVWFPTCSVVILEQQIPSIQYWIIFMACFFLGLLLIGEMAHRFCGKCLTKRIALPGTISDPTSGIAGGPYGDSGFTKAVFDWRSRVMRVAFFGFSDATFTSDASSASGQDAADPIPERDRKAANTSASHNRA